MGKRSRYTWNGARGVLSMNTARKFRSGRVVYSDAAALGRDWGKIGGDFRTAVAELPVPKDGRTLIKR